MRCYKSEMSKIVDRWLLFEYLGPEFTPLSKPFKTREQAEKARALAPAQEDWAWCDQAHFLPRVVS